MVTLEDSHNVHTVAEVFEHLDRSLQLLQFPPMKLIDCHIQQYQLGQVQIASVDKYRSSHDGTLDAG